MPDHDAHCDCIQCQLANGYVEMSLINLNEARAFEKVENEALQRAE